VQQASRSRPLLGRAVSCANASKRARIDALHPGAFATLDGKAQKIVGVPGPLRGDPVADGFKSGAIEVMIGYCSGAGRMRSQI
jgi:hypothetical protein